MKLEIFLVKKEIQMNQKYKNMDSQFQNPILPLNLTQRNEDPAEKIGSV